MASTLDEAVSRFGLATMAKLATVAATGEPEEQLRAPLEQLWAELAELCHIRAGDFTAIGETKLDDLKCRPDYAISIRKALVGFVEIKAPGKGANPKQFRDHDKEQWEKLKSLPNLLYTDGNEFSLWRNGERVHFVKLHGDVRESGADLAAPPALLNLHEDFFRWEPLPPRDAQQLADTAARLCRLLRDEVEEQMGRGAEALAGLAKDWRQHFFPDATDAEFADGYSQAVTFGMLIARARGINLTEGIAAVASRLKAANSLIGAALRLLTDDAESGATLKTSLGTLSRVLQTVDWDALSKGKPETWLYFYEEFLAVYDNALRKETGSYYTPPEVVEAMVGMVDEALRTHFPSAARHGIASQDVTIADPAAGTGTFLLGVLRRIARTFAESDGAGTVAAAINAAVGRVSAFEKQLGPFAVAQLRIHAELAALIGKAPATEPQLYLTDTLASPYLKEEPLPQMLAAITEARRKANKVKLKDPITVVIGNPPYKEKAKGRGGWVERGDPHHTDQTAPLDAWQPPTEWGVGAHAKHLRNLYVYFWRWATWKVFDHDPQHNTGIVCFITVAGFLDGPGFQRMREYLRQTCDDLWVIDCSPEGHQPEVASRIFQGVQQPVCIVLACRTGEKKPKALARVRYRAVPVGRREDKFAALGKIKLHGRGWQDCRKDGRAPFRPAPKGAWADFPTLEELFVYSGSGVMPGRTWVIAPDAETLLLRWKALQKAKDHLKEALFVPHEGGDRSVVKEVRLGLPGYVGREKSVADDKNGCLPPARYAYRSFDRQWLIPDNRLINRPNPNLWAARSKRQIFLTAPTDRKPTAGPSLTFAACVPDLHHYHGRGGRAFPLWRNAHATEPNFPPGLLPFLKKQFGKAVSPEDLLAYLAAVVAHPAYIARFKADLVQPGLRIPLTAEAKLFFAAAELGRRVVWLHTYGERFADAKHGRPPGAPRMPKGEAPTIPKAGAIPDGPDDFPNELAYDSGKRRLLVGKGFVDNVPPEVWAYEVSGKQTVKQWFSYRRLNREKPPMGDKRPPSELCAIQPEGWLPEYTADLLDLLNVLAGAVALEPEQAALLEKICAAELLDADDLRKAGALECDPAARKKLPERENGESLF